MATHNGQAFLDEQLESLASQTHGAWQLHVSDDGSTDATRSILQSVGESWGPQKISIRTGPCEGFARNFASLLVAADIHADAFAFCDQDDVWETWKLERAVAWLMQIPPDVPALWCSRTRYIDVDGRELGLSPRMPRGPSFGNALVQNIAGGNTMVFNAAARRLIARAAEVREIPAHDWLAYLVVTAVGGRVHHEQEPSVRYRQHSGNAIGNGRAMNAWKARLKRLLQRELKRSIATHVVALKAIQEDWSDAVTLAIRDRPNWAGGGLMAGMRLMARHRLHRQTLMGTMALLGILALN